MLLEFRVSNYRSIGEEQILSLRPAPKQKDFVENVLLNGKYQALNVIALYGANGSGKSNLLLAMNLLDRLVHISARTSSVTKLPYDPFLLRDGWDNKPTKFEVTFIIDDVKYRYGLEFLQHEVVSEWLYRKSTGREVPVFLRRGEIIEAYPSLKGNSKVIDAAIEATRPNGLFLSVCDMLNLDEAKTIFRWFRNFGVVDGINTEDEEIRTVNMWQNPEDKTSITEYIERLNIGILGINITTKDFDESDLPSSLAESARNSLIEKLSGAKSYSITAEHRVYDIDGQETNKTLSWKFVERESQGTNKAFHLSGPILYVIKNGGVLVIDEIEAKMHPLITLDTIRIFLDRSTNPNNAQLIFATHDTNLLTYSRLRRDQIYFTEKNKWESTEIYSLSDFIYVNDSTNRPEKERTDTDKEKRYIEGRYGAIPVLGSFKG